MTMDRAAEIIARGDPMEIVGMAMRAREAYEDGRVCECAEPSLHGRDLMCGNCLLENQGQRDALEASMRDPHPFEESRRSDAARRLGMCDLCAGWKDDPRHV
jgi:hypothetical protein